MLSVGDRVRVVRELNLYSRGVWRTILAAGKEGVVVEAKADSNLITIRVEGKTYSVFKYTLEKI